jgi:hypothetical protein
MYLSQKEKVLLSFLGIIFISQIYFLGMAVQYCKNNGGLNACPEIGKRVEVTFAGMTATVLALITNIGTGRSTK